MPQKKPGWVLFTVTVLALLLPRGLGAQNAFTFSRGCFARSHSTSAEEKPEPSVRAEARYRSFFSLGRGGSGSPAQGASCSLYPATVLHLGYLYAVAEFAAYQSADSNYIIQTLSGARQDAAALGFPTQGLDRIAASLRRRGDDDEEREGREGREDENEGSSVDSSRAYQDLVNLGQQYYQMADGLGNCQDGAKVSYVFETGVLLGYMEYASYQDADPQLLLQYIAKGRQYAAAVGLPVDGFDQIASWLNQGYSSASIFQSVDNVIRRFMQLSSRICLCQVGPAQARQPGPIGGGGQTGGAREQCGGPDFFFNTTFDWIDNGRRLGTINFYRDGSTQVRGWTNERHFWRTDTNGDLIINAPEPNSTATVVRLTLYPSTCSFRGARDRSSQRQDGVQTEIRPPGGAGTGGGPPGGAGNTGGGPTGGGATGGTAIKWTDYPLAGKRSDNKSKNGQRFTYSCPPNGAPSPLGIIGTDIYTDDSSICLAAVHAGLITFASGGTVTVEVRIPGPNRYTGNQRNGVSSRGYDNGPNPTPGAYVFVP